ncbi:MAG: 2Fe-2S iron-sulfur cluster-binding protein [Chloroflexota bacterium]|nr:MAG: (2Fe-2S)-binding protein [Chloroflexota bacterium]
MPKITVNGKSAEWPADKRLVLAIEDMGINIGHRCGGNARCTTCRVRFISGEPETMTAAEYAKLNERGLYGQYRLSCQIVCDHDMEVEPVMTLENQDWTDTGPRPEDTVQPVAEWFPRAELERS